MPDQTPLECAAHCRELAERTYDLAEQAQHPEVIEDYLAIAAKLLHCAEEAEAEERAQVSSDSRSAPPK